MTRSMSVQTLMSQFVTPDGVPPWIGAICGSVAFPGSALIWRSKLLRSFALSHHLQHTARVWACRSVKLCQALSISPSYFQSSAPVCLPILNGPYQKGSCSFSQVSKGFSRPFRFASGLVVLQKKREHYTFRAGCAVLDTSQSSDCLYPCVTLDLRPRMKFVASIHSSGHLLLLLDPAVQMCHLQIVSNFLLANLKCGTSCNSVT